MHRLWAKQDRTVGTKLIVATVPLIALVSMIAAVVEHVRITANLEEKLATRAKSIAHQIMADQQYYAAVIVPRAIALGGTLGVDYHTIPGRFPLPATFVREVSEATAKIPNGYTANLISPLAINKEKGVKDQFHLDGFAFLVQHPDQPFIRTDTIQGLAVLRVLMADLASAKSCVDCHNAHAQSPRHDFKLNDLMGGLEIAMPMDQYLKENDLNLLLTLAGGGVMCLLVLVIAGIGSRRTVAQPLGALAGQMRAFVGEAGGSSGMPEEPPAGDKVVSITAAFERMKAVIAAQPQELREANQLLEWRVLERTEQLRQTMAEKERIGSELRIAGAI
ncbi:c-type heme family protein [Nitrospira sp. Kam-Ns4a]